MATVELVTGGEDASSVEDEGRRDGLALVAGGGARRAWRHGGGRRAWRRGVWWDGEKTCALCGSARQRNEWRRCEEIRLGGGPLSTLPAYRGRMSHA